MMHQDNQSRTNTHSVSIFRCHNSPPTPRPHASPGTNGWMTGSSRAGSRSHRNCDKEVCCLLCNIVFVAAIKIVLARFSAIRRRPQGPGIQVPRERAWPEGEGSDPAGTIMEDGLGNTLRRWRWLRIEIIRRAGDGDDHHNGSVWRLWGVGEEHRGSPMRVSVKEPTNGAPAFTTVGTTGE